MKGTFKNRSQAGFTLVELAIVMIIIGLLIAGVLKGQELIANAQVTSTIAQVKSVDAATSTFRDTYNALPGDMLSPTTRLPNCTTGTVCGNAGDGNGRLDNLPGADPVGAEGEAFFVQLSVTSLLSGVQPSATSSAIGLNFPAAKISGNGYQAGYGTGTAAANLAAVLGTGVPSAGVYLTLTNTIGVQSTSTTGLRPSAALRIDTKLDDSDPSNGDIRGFGTAGTGATACGTSTDAGTPGEYATANTGNNCGLYIKIQN